MPELTNTALGSDANLKGYWRLEANGNDSSASGYNLTAHNTPTFVAGKFGNCTSLVAASTQYFSIASASCPNLEITGSQSWFCWVNMTTLAGEAMNKTKSDNSAFRKMDINAGIGGFTCYVSGLTPNSVSASVAMSTGVWTFIGWVYDSSGGKLKCWVDNNVNSVAASGSASATGAEFTIGRDSDRAVTYLDGKLDDAYVFNRALTDTEVLSLFNYRSLALLGVG